MPLSDLLRNIAAGCVTPIDDEELEKIVSTQEDASLKSPSVEAHYYRFFYRLCQQIKPSMIVELGTHTGISSMCFAKGNPEGKVITVNHKDEVWPECMEDNIEYRITDSLAYLGFEKPGIDVLFIDTEHNGIRCGDEFNAHSKYVKQSGIIFFDDIYLNEEMRAFWEDFSPKGYEKFELDVHGDAGFGVLIKQEAQEV